MPIAFLRPLREWIWWKYARWHTDALILKESKEYLDRLRCKTSEEEPNEQPRSNAPAEE
jgi:hypothetical protein